MFNNHMRLKAYYSSSGGGSVPLPKELQLVDIEWDSDGYDLWTRNFKQTFPNLGEVVLGFDGDIAEDVYLKFHKDQKVPQNFEALIELYIESYAEFSLEREIEIKCNMVEHYNFGKVWKVTMH